jgi:hypothetical protein
MFLKRALASVLSQTVRPREILVVVDGEEQQVPEVAAQVEGIACGVLAVGRTGGAGAARNRGAREAHARYLCFLDDDDVWKPGYLAAVFADGPTFDLALTAFEKHTLDGARPEKVPPEVLEPEAFLVANPGLRGSNLVLTRELFWVTGGFSERLPSFNDMDFGLRLVEAHPARYRRITEPLVEYHAHDGERLSRRGARSIPPGMEGFLQTHGPKMDHRQEAAFRARALGLWGVDPWELTALERRLQQAMADGSVPEHFPGILHAAETALLEATCRSDAEADAYQEFIDRVIGSLERQPGAPRLRRLRAVVITTDTPGSVDGLLSSLQCALDRSGWRSSLEGPIVEVLFVRNDRDLEIDQAHDAILRTWADRRVSVVQRCVPVSSRPLSLTEARVFAYGAARDRGWVPSPDEPLWMLDEDFRFEILAPSSVRGFRRMPGGSLLHRVECLALRHGRQGIDALIGGNSGAAPVPALGTLRRQLTDLVSASGLAREVEDRERALSDLLRRRDPYYDLTTDRGQELHVPVCVAWWCPSGEWSWERVVDRMLHGLPVTRPALPWLLDAPASAWGDLEPATIAGGNTILLGPRVLRPDAFVQVRWGSVRSRRGDTTWCINCQASGARIARASFPLFHDRTPRKGAHAREAAVRDMLADALGVGLYEVLKERGCVDREMIGSRAGRRLGTVLESLKAATTLLEAPDSCLPQGVGAELLDFVRHSTIALSCIRFDTIELTSAPAS